MVDHFFKGQFLLDGGNLAGSWFHRTVVLICEHNADGAFGLVLNRATGDSVEDVLLADLPEPVKELPVFLGGPVQPGALSFLHSDDFLPESNVLPNLQLDHSLDNLIELGGSFSISRKLRIFAGYSGWSPGQLEDEMRRGSWLTHPADLDLIFKTPPEELWKTVVSLKGWKYRLMSDAPDDLSRN